MKAVLNQSRGEILMSGESLMELAASVLDKNASFRVRAKGFSMSPVVKENDIIVISPLRGKKPGCGDVLAFSNSISRSLTVHRVIKKNDGFFCFRGDNSIRPAEVVSEDRILGRLTRVERNGKKIRWGLGPERLVIGFLNRKRGFAFLVRMARQVSRTVRGEAV